jgi:hypothetical protein
VGGFVTYAVDNSAGGRGSPVGDRSFVKLVIRGGNAAAARSALSFIFNHIAVTSIRADIATPASTTRGGGA